jgi:tetratricopeptide (TPR) repeat protein
MSGPFDELEKEAETLENRSKEEFIKKNFVAAISLLEEAKKIYSKLAYHGKIGMIDKRIFQLRNLVKYQNQDTLVQTKSEIDLQKRAEKVLQEKKRYDDLKMAEKKALSPDMKQNLEKIDLLLNKAEKEEKLGKYSRVLGRYEYLLELYKSLPKEIVNFSKEIYELERKIAIIREKI